MVPFLRSHTARTPDSFKIEPAETIDLPTVLTYTFIPVTGAIIAKKHGQSTDGSSRPKKKRPSTGSAAEVSSAKKKAKPDEVAKRKAAATAEDESAVFNMTGKMCLQ